MSRISADRVRDTTTSTGTGAITVSGTAPATNRAFSAVLATNDVFDYFIVHRTLDEWETGEATWNGSNQFTRTTVRASSNGGAATVFSAGTKDCVMGPTAYRSFNFARLLETIKVADYTTTPADEGLLLVANKATAITFTLHAIAQAGSGVMQIENIGAGDLTIDANAAETIETNGVAGLTLVLKTGDSARISANGTLWRSTVSRRPATDTEARAAADALHFLVPTNLLAILGPMGQCRLTKVSTNLQLDRFGGRMLFINGAYEQVPSAGVTLAAPNPTVTMTIASPAVATLVAHGLVAGSPIMFATSGALPTGVTAGLIYFVIAAGLATDTFRFAATPGGAAINTSGTQSGTHKLGTLRRIYAYMSAGTMTLEQSTTVEAVDATYGHKIKTGDATRTLVGLAFDVTSGAATIWADSGNQLFVLSWFSRLKKVGKATKTGAANSGSNAIANNTTTERLHWISWGDSSDLLTLFGGSHGAAAQNAGIGLYKDGVSVELAGSIRNMTFGGGNYALSWSSIDVAINSEGYHYGDTYFSGDTVNAHTIDADTRQVEVLG